MTTASTSTTWLRASGRAVPLLAGPDALGALGPTLDELGVRGRLFVVADERAVALHGVALDRALPDAPRLAIGGDEPHKTLDQAQLVWSWLIDQGAQRSDVVVAFGGGVVCDLAGFVAACYLRGVGLVNAPTTLLAQVDASVGGKTGVNHARGKNLIGAFYQPLAVVADTGLLATLSQRTFAAGMAEIVKIAMAMDAALFDRLEQSSDQLSPTAADALTPVVARAIALKAGVVERDERESGERMLLNYGHTVGHALEAATSYADLLHGEAVAIGMRSAGHIAVGQGLLDSSGFERQQRLLARFDLPTRAPSLPVETVLGRVSVDKKRVGARQRWVLAHGVGHAEVHDDVPDALVREAIELVLR